jgi:hypothetical protein
MLPKTLHVLKKLHHLMLLPPLNFRHLLLLPLLLCQALGLHSRHLLLLPLLIGHPQGLQSLDLGLHHFTTMFE